MLYSFSRVNWFILALNAICYCVYLLSLFKNTNKNLDGKKENMYMGR